MKFRSLSRDGGATFIIVFDEGDEFIGCLAELAKRQGIRGSHFTGIGAFSGAVVGFFDWRSKSYDRIPIAEQVEVLSLAGDIATDAGEPKVHAHVVVGKRDGSAHGGHLFEARVRPTLEVILVEEPTHLRRRFNAAAGLALVDLEA
jgi:uncharacterized protein